jgi:dihydrofolate reductase
MTKLVLMMGCSLDGYVAVPSDGGLAPVLEPDEGPDGIPAEDPELRQAKLDWAWQGGAHLMGRVTYEEMASFWPTSTADYAAPMNEIPKVVFSKTLERADWPESRIGRGDLAEEIAKLKDEFDKDLIAWGGASFAQSLAREGLIDEYRLVTHAVAVAGGAPLFKDLPKPQRLEFVETKSFDRAVVHVLRPA